ncbi:MAG: rhodanese-like domain-containing protein [Bacteroidales bacterium]
MKHIRSIYVILTILMVFTTLTHQGCRSAQQAKEPDADGFALLINHIEHHHDFVNSEVAPGAIGIDAVLNYEGDKMLLIDIRPLPEFQSGHLAEAVNITMEGLLDYFELSIDPAGFDTIVIISTDGQDALFATTLMRLLGYDNVFGLRLGMGWHKQFADTVWGRKLSSEYELRLSPGPSPQLEAFAYPAFQSDGKDGYTLLRERARELLRSGYKDYRIAAKEVFAAADSFYIINYWPENEYLIGHIPGARQYTPKKSLSRKTSLNTLPPDKPIVIYCHQGNMSSSATAYLLLLGYDVKSLEFGSNSFMYNLHKGKIGRNIFDPLQAIDYPLMDKSNSGKIPKVPVLVEIKSQGGC